jgi:hypothetical protein
MACRNRYAEEPGRPQGLLAGESLGVRYTANEAHKGKPGDGTMLEPRAPEWNTAREAEEYCERKSPPQAFGESYQA